MHSEKIKKSQKQLLTLTINIVPLLR